MSHVPLDEFLRDYDVNEVHSIEIAGTPDSVMAAARSLTSREVRLATVLMALRGLPAAILRPRGRWGHSDRIPDAPLLDNFIRGGFVVLADRPDELVLSAVGRFWKLDGEVRRVSPEEFVTFDEPGFAKAVVNLHAEAVDGGTVLTTETRVKLTDDEARRTFRRYWRVVMPGSALIRRAWLRAIKKRAERGGGRDERRH